VSLAELALPKFFFKISGNTNSASDKLTHPKRSSLCVSFELLNVLQIPSISKQQQIKFTCRISGNLEYTAIFRTEFTLANNIYFIGEGWLNDCIFSRKVFSELIKHFLLIDIIPI
jgi:hypothetical protein